ncbi:MAG: DNA replication and repair protein RecF [Bacilli bacterium]
MKAVLRRSSTTNNNEEFFKIKLTCFNEEISSSKKLEVILDQKGKKVKINTTLKRKISEFISQYKVILFSPDELKIIKDSPSTRRTYLNIEISQIYKHYLKFLNDYNKLIKNKNEYLKKVYLNSNLDLNYMDILDIKLASTGKIISDYRKDYIEKINKYIPKIFNKFKEKDTLRIEYVSDFLNKSEDEIIKILKKNRKKEMLQGMTSTGIHRDDFIFIHNENNSKEYSSEGLQKLIVLSMKLSELNVLTKAFYEKPILLLDDLFSELDQNNQNKILKYLPNNIQIFITTTDLNNVDKKILTMSNIIELDEEVK